MINEEGLRDWFGKSKSKDGKKGWVNVVTGDSCASDKPGEGVPKCVSSAKRASMSKKERVAAQAAKRREDPGQQSKSGAAKPTNVKTDRKVKEDMEFNEAEDKKGKGSGKKDACYHKVKSRYSVWPSAYASGALVKCRKKGAKNWGSSTKKEEYMALPEMTDSQIKAMRDTGIEVHVFNENMRLIKEKEVKVKDTRRTVDAIRAYDRSKDASRDATYDTDHGKKKKGDKEKAYAKKERGEIDKDDPNWKHRKYHTGMHGEGYAPGDVDQKVGAVTSIPKSEQDAAKARLLAKAAKKRSMADKIKEDRERLESMDEATYPSDFVNPDGSKRAVAKPKRDNRNMRPKQHDQETDSYGRRKTVDEEVEQLDEISLKTKMKAYAATRDPDADYMYGTKVHDQGDRIKKNIIKKHGEAAGKHAEKHAEAEHYGRGKGYPKNRIEKNRTYRTRKDGKMHGQDQNKLKSDLKKRATRKEELEEAQLPNADGNIYMVTFSWRGKLMYMKVFFPEPYGPTPERVEYAMNKIYPGAKVRSYDMAFVNQGDAYLNPGTDEGGSSGKK